MARYFVLPHVLPLHINVIITASCSNSTSLARCLRMLVLTKCLQRIALNRFQQYCMHVLYLFFLSLNDLAANRIGCCITELVVGLQFVKVLWMELDVVEKDKDAFIHEFSKVRLIFVQFIPFACLLFLPFSFSCFAERTGHIFRTILK